MIIIIDQNKQRVSTIRKLLRPRFYCTVAQNAEHLNNLLQSMQPAAVIADVETMEELGISSMNMLLMLGNSAAVIFLMVRSGLWNLETLESRGMHVLNPQTELRRLEEILLPLSEKNGSRNPAVRQPTKLSRLRDHMFCNLLEGHDLPRDTDQMMDFLGLTSPTEKYYLAFVISFASKFSEGLMENVWEIALHIQEIAREEISRIAINRSCIRTPGRVAFVLLMREPGEPFRYELEQVLEIVHRRIDRECGNKINVGVGLADRTINGIAMGYRQACDALDQGRFFGSSFVCFYCDLFDCNTQRFQLSQGFREQVAQALYHEEPERIDELLESQLHRFYTLGLATRDNIMALKIDIAVMLMDLADRLAITAENSQFYSQLIYDILKVDSLSALEIIIKQHLREMAHTSQAGQNRRAGRIVRNAQSIIANEIRQPINVQLLAHQMKISPNYLSAVFKSETGVRLTEYIASVKMQEAARLIRETDRNIAEISVDLGYDGANYFSKLFKKHYGVNPSDYRQSNSVET